MKKGIELIAEERQRQIDVEGYSEQTFVEMIEDTLFNIAYKKLCFKAYWKMFRRRIARRT